MTSKTIYFDANRCVGCHACAVACMDQNDLDLTGADPAYRRIMHFESNEAGEVRVAHVSSACMHCDSAECLDACPSGALRRDVESGAVIVRRELCIGCHACAMACPFGIPRFGRDGTMQKCDGCYARTRFGYKPACVEICPTGALDYLDVNEAMARKHERFAASLAGTAANGIGGR